MEALLCLVNLACMELSDNRSLLTKRTPARTPAKSVQGTMETKDPMARGRVGDVSLYNSRASGYRIRIISAHCVNSEDAESLPCPIHITALNPSNYH